MCTRWHAFSARRQLGEGLGLGRERSSTGASPRDLPAPGGVKAMGKEGVRQRGGENHGGAEEGKGCL